MTSRRRKIHFGFSFKRESDGAAQGIGVVKIKPRNAYELLGLRKPSLPRLGKA